MALKGKVAIVTGAARGIGRGIAVAMGEAGADVALVDICHPEGRYPTYGLASRAELDETAAQIRGKGGKAVEIEADLTKSGDVRRMVDRVVKELGRVDILVNNAGVIVAAPVVDMDEEAWDRTFDVNVKGVFLCSKAVAPIMIKQRSGKIINIASIAGKTARTPGVAAYSASKFAVVGFTQALARELAGYSIQVNAICPGIVYTKMWEYLSEVRGKDMKLPPKEAFKRIVADRILLGKPQTPQDIANLAVFLASSAADNITAQSINVCGGIEVH
jgi:NAD(P)-dependent dehydrogenase (short-subunit alcohol dehydrogenase family)